MNLFEFKIDRVAEVLLDQCKIFNCDVDIAWKNFMHPIITEQFTLEEVKYHIEKMNNPTYPNNNDLAKGFVETVLKRKNIKATPDEKEVAISLIMMVLTKIDKLKD